jgi:hypothetical protein
MPTDKIELRLYIAGDSPRSQIAMGSVRRIEETLGDVCCLEIVDILEQPGRAEEDGIMATPTLLRVAPAPQRRIIGDLGTMEQVFRALGRPWEPRGELQ